MHSTMSIDADETVLHARLKATALATKAGFLTKQVFELFANKQEILQIIVSSRLVAVQW